MGCQAKKIKAYPMLPAVLQLLRAHSVALLYMVSVYLNFDSGKLEAVCA
jgi:hypothetical protein